jgi:AcrR family transcriptional regulator
MARNTPSPEDREEESPGARRRERRKSKRENTREEILTAARKVLLENGVGGTTLDAVANEAGMSKTAIYYYFASKDALLYELIFAILEAQAKGVHDAIEATGTGGDALRALIATTITFHTRQIDDFRLVYLHNQVAASRSTVTADQLARIRPLNDLQLAGAADRIAASGRPNRAGLEPRVLAFLAQLAAIGMLTLKGSVEAVNDPLLYSDEQLIEGMSAVFAAAAEPAEKS